MKSLLQLIIKHSTFMLFLLLEVLSFILFFQSNNYAKIHLLNSANQIVGISYRTTRTIIDFFSLYKENEKLNEENSALRQYVHQLEKANIENSYVSSQQNQNYKYRYQAAKIIQSTTNKKKNYLTINKGINSGVNRDMAVINNDGLVGMITASSNNYSVVIPLINTDLLVSCRLKRSGQIGNLQWSGKNYRYATLNDIGSHIEVHEGDTVITSGLSSIFPDNIVVGTVKKVEQNNSKPDLDITVNFAVDFGKLNFVSIIKNENITEEKEIIDSYTK